MGGKVLLNPSLPIAVVPDNGVILNVTMNVTEGGTYQIDLFTSRGTMFSKTTQVPAGNQTGVILYKANINFYGSGTKIDIDIGNSGTSDTQLTQVYVGTSQTALQNKTTTPALPITLLKGSIIRATVNFNWTSGETYYFKIVSTAGFSVEFQEQAPQ